MAAPCHLGSGDSQWLKQRPASRLEPPTQEPPIPCSELKREVSAVRVATSRVTCGGGSRCLASAKVRDPAEVIAGAVSPGVAPQMTVSFADAVADAGSVSGAGSSAGDAVADAGSAADATAAETGADAADGPRADEPQETTMSLAMCIYVYKYIQTPVEI